MQAGARVGTQANDVARVGRNFRVHQNNLQHKNQNFSKKTKTLVYRGSGKHNAIDLAGTRLQQGLGGCIKRHAGGQNIVHQNNALPFNGVHPAGGDMKGMLQVAKSGLTTEQMLRSGCSGLVVF